MTVKLPDDTELKLEVGMLMMRCSVSPEPRSLNPGTASGRSLHFAATTHEYSQNRYI